MKFGSYILLLGTSAACAVLCVGLIVVSHYNQKLQIELQTKQQLLNNGLFGAQGQQLSAGILQDMAAAASSNAAIQRLLEKNGYQLGPQKPVKKETETEVSKKTRAKERQ